MYNEKEEVLGDQFPYISGSYMDLSWLLEEKESSKENEE